MDEPPPMDRFAGYDHMLRKGSRFPARITLSHFPGNKKRRTPEIGRARRSDSPKFSQRSTNQAVPSLNIPRLMTGDVYFRRGRPLPLHKPDPKIPREHECDNRRFLFKVQMHKGKSWSRHLDCRQRQNYRDDPLLGYDVHNLTAAKADLSIQASTRKRRHMLIPPICFSA